MKIEKALLLFEQYHNDIFDYFVNSNFTNSCYINNTLGNVSNINYLIINFLYVKKQILTFTYSIDGELKSHLKNYLLNFTNKLNTTIFEILKINEHDFTLSDFF